MQDPAEFGNNHTLSITPETLEDKLLYDDVFVDYFNVFLQLKAFPTPMRYERLDGFFLEEFTPDDPELKQLVDDRGKFHQQGTVTSWIKDHRLPFFLRSHLFLEFKLCKLLLRKLLETSRMPQSRLELRGYSRAVSPYIPVSPQWGNSPVYCMSQASWPEKGLPQYYNRPLGSASSLPAMLSLALETRLKFLEGPPPKKLSTAGNEENSVKLAGQDDASGNGHSSGTNVNKTNNHYDVSFCESINKEKNNLEHYQKEDVFDGDTSRSLITSAQSRRIKNSRKRKTSLFTPSCERSAETRTRGGKSGQRRTRSAPVEGGLALGIRAAEGSHDAFLDDCDIGLAFGEDDTIFDFDDREDDGSTEAELQSIVDESKRNLQEMKEDALKSTLGMNDFRNFLHGTSGIHLLNFWLDVEEYKDLEKSNLKNEHTLQMMRIKLFREINDKYKNYLTSETKQKITGALNINGLTNDLFTMTQYDALRRLRSYWIPRFLVHKEKTRDARMIQMPQSRLSGFETALSFLPTISFVHSLPPRGDWCTELARRSCDWSKNLTLTDGRSLKQVRPTTADGRNDYQNFLSGISSEKEAGWPFHSFLEKVNKKDEASNLLFWQSIEDLKNEEVRRCDRHLHLCNAWNIVKQFLADEAEMLVSMNNLDKLKIIEKLRNSMEVSSTLFKSGQTHALVILRIPWEEYKKDDQEVLKRVPSAHQFSSRSKNDSGRHSLFYHGFFSPGKWYPRYPESSPSERQRRLHTALTIAENIQATRMSSQSPQKSQASVRKEISPKKTKAVKIDAREKPVKFGSKKENNVTVRANSQDGGKEEEKIQENPPLEFLDVVGDKATISSFKHYMQNAEGSHGMNSLAMFLDIESYKAIPSSRKAERTQQASKIFKDFFDSSSRRNVHLPARIPYQVQNECPSSPSLLEAQQHVLADIKTSFRQFHKSQRVPKPAVETNTPQTKLQNTKPVAKTDAPSMSTSYLVYYKRRRNKFKGPGRVQPTKEDKLSFVKELRENSGPLSLTLELFQRYVDSNDDIQGESVSKLENDLFFYLQVQKFKDLFNYMDDTTLLKKMDAIVECFLDSATPPSVQIDISSDLAGRIVHKTQLFHNRCKQSREQRDSLIFDEAQNIVLKELLPFWAGFMTQQHDSPSTEPLPDELPPTRRQMIMKRRYSEFKKFPLKNRPTSLRSVLPGIGESKRELNFSVADGLAWKEGDPDEIESVFSMNVRGSTRSGSMHVSRETNMHSTKSSLMA